MIYGVGIDVVEVRRIEDSMARFGRRLAEKILSAEECLEYDQSPRKARFLARRFAAKEALVKALGTGFRAGLFPGAISVTHDALGKPDFRLTTPISSALEQRGICKSHLSITDEREYALAYVLLESN
ncbi:MAG: holo-ACP synthase [Gammaproteobacteria bacterium RIFCSPLOWO2_02_FULL_61_13]|nr:MAG: holo-ACP synthase [Gammaproteobacteria bacterium RIFCSPLOWO2_02_FULL_61_13]